MPSEATSRRPSAVGSVDSSTSESSSSRAPSKTGVAVVDSASPYTDEVAPALTVITGATPGQPRALQLSAPSPADWPDRNARAWGLVA